MARVSLSSILSSLNDEGLIRMPAPKLNSRDEAFSCFCKIGDAMLKWQNRRFNPEPCKEVIMDMIDWAYMLDDHEGKIDYSKGWLLKGHVKKGKTLILRIFSEFLRIDDLRMKVNGKEYPIFPIFTSTIDMASQYMNLETGGYKTIDKYSSLPSLIVDDLTAENKTQGNYGNKMNVTNTVLYKRHEANLLTFATTNLNTFEDADGFDDRMQRRIKDMFNIRGLNHNVNF